MTHCINSRNRSKIYCSTLTLKQIHHKKEKHGHTDAKIRKADNRQSQSLPNWYQHWSISPNIKHNLKSSCFFFETVNKDNQWVFTCVLIISTYKVQCLSLLFFCRIPLIYRICSSEYINKFNLMIVFPKCDVSIWVSSRLL